MLNGSQAVRSAKFPNPWIKTKLNWAWVSSRGLNGYRWKPSGAPRKRI